MTGEQKPSAARTFVPWTAEDRARLVALGDALVASGAVGLERWPEVARQFPGRSWLACRQQYSLCKRVARGHVEPVHRNVRKVNGRISRVGDDKMQTPPPASAQPRYASITAWAFGDPPIGRSALDQKQGASA